MSKSWDELRSERGIGGKAAQSDFAAMMIEMLPGLGKFLCNYTNDQGTPVLKQGSVTLFYEGGRLKACLNDHYARLKGFVTLKDFTDPLGEIEVMLQGGKVEWAEEKVRR